MQDVENFSEILLFNLSIVVYFETCSVVKCSYVALIISISSVMQCNL